MLKRKAFIFSLDAVIAVIIAGMMLLACFFYLSQTSTNIYKSQDLYKVSSDSLTILEKGNTLKTAVEANSTAAIQQFLNSLPGQFCGNITIYTSASASLLSAQKTGCSSENEFSTAIRAFIAGNTEYYAKMELWYK
jgi:hypothetical protein